MVQPGFVITWCYNLQKLLVSFLACLTLPPRTRTLSYPLPPGGAVPPLLCLIPGSFMPHFAACDAPTCPDPVRKKLLYRIRNSYETPRKPTFLASVGLFWFVMELCCWPTLKGLRPKLISVLTQRNTPKSIAKHVHVYTHVYISVYWKMMQDSKLILGNAATFQTGTWGNGTTETPKNTLKRETT